jgi:ATP-dependent protease ClpP protease subunit
MTAAEAKEYGLIDEIILPRRGVAAVPALELAAAAGS